MAASYLVTANVSIIAKSGADLNAGCGVVFSRQTSNMSRVDERLR